jgi:hypothetical protein
VFIGISAFSDRLGAFENGLIDLKTAYSVPPTQLQRGVRL